MNSICPTEAESHLFPDDWLQCMSTCWNVYALDLEITFGCFSLVWNVENRQNVQKQMSTKDKAGCAYHRNKLFFQEGWWIEECLSHLLSHTPTPSAPQEKVEIFDPERNHAWIGLDFSSLSFYLSLQLWAAPSEELKVQTLIFPLDQTKEESHEDVIKDTASFYKLFAAAVNTQNKASILQVPSWTSKKFSRFNTN